MLKFFNSCLVLIFGLCVVTNVYAASDDKALSLASNTAASDPATNTSAIEQNNSLALKSLEYERVINEYTKYLSSVPKEVKEEEIKYFENLADIDKELVRLRKLKTSLYMQLSDAVKSHQAKKRDFERKLRFLSSIQNDNLNKAKKKYSGRKKNNNGTSFKSSFKK
ncbi:hypothetical protein [Candidatus Sneabacter namystus]|uniref:Uncharacterized protein n=1 Tax=Candidatus Sneabacter namystus TaxID=2601646 RepID=A0A5C0ULR5_9RICK|nr:hypothetical protein [Candidatus Sneabacter namystus]QEK39824.1 hypothetical protein FZC37_02720 [Candidatus Sneabacter namystus]